MDNVNTDNYKVYMHISPSHKYYIGITGMDLSMRFKNGFGYKHQRYFWNAIQKYGWNNFIHLLIADSLTKEQACDMEIMLIGKFKSNNHSFGYNLSSGGEYGSKGTHPVFTDEHKSKISKSHIGTHCSELTKIKISQSKKGMKLSKETKLKIGKASLGRLHTVEEKEKISQWHKGKKKNFVSKSNKIYKSKPVSQYTLDGHFIKEYCSAREAERKTGYKESHINNCCIGTSISCHGFIWRYTKECNNEDLIVSKSLKNQIIKSRKNKMIFQYDLKGNYLNSYKSAAEIKRLTGFSNCSILNCCNYKSKQSHGFIWRFANINDISESGEL